MGRAIEHPTNEDLFVGTPQYPTNEDLFVGTPLGGRVGPAASEKERESSKVMGTADCEGKLFRVEYGTGYTDCA